MTLLFAFHGGKGSAKGVDISVSKSLINTRMDFIFLHRFETETV
jgi:hypothetical protein